MKTPQFDVSSSYPELEPVRTAIREFLAADPAMKTPHADSWSHFDAAFSRRLGAAGFIGMTWPKRYGGGERSSLERYVVVEELCAAGAPSAAHWIADRQTGPQILRFGTEEQRERLLPAIARGECYCAIGMSEPESGSDLASVRTRATRDGDGWVINGRKIWTSYAHQSHYLLALCRTGTGPEATRQQGLSQMLIPLDTPGISLRPIVNMAGKHDFNEVLFEDVHVSADSILGQEGAGWSQVISELAFERSGPERFLSSFVLLEAFVASARRTPSPEQTTLIGSLIARLVPLRGMSMAVAAQLGRGESPNFEAALVKETGSMFEQDIGERLLGEIAEQADPGSTRHLNRLFAETVLSAPSYSLRGGTREILRGIIAREMGLR
ncbi:MAG TPA: acyl-CoA dehydrogenase family protein [Candidatus Binataceae bacterium]|nr:acyl-CoA dehydrogenase family protein [Candidatus Binataceae bacterium]